MTNQVQGVLDRWCGEYGFVAGDDSNRYFLHVNETRRAGLKAPAPGQRIRFEVESSAKGLRATKPEYVQ